MSWNLYPSYHPLYPGPDPSYLSYSCPGLTSVPETIANVNHSPRGNQDQDRQYQGEQQMSEPTGNNPYMEYVGLSRDGATGRISGNMLQDIQPQGMFGQRVNEPTRNRKSRRTQFTSFQLVELEATFNQSQYVSTDMRQSLSQQLGLTEENVKNWFKNRRVKWRKGQRLIMRPVCRLVSAPVLHHAHAEP